MHLPKFFLKTIYQFINFKILDLEESDIFTWVGQKIWGLTFNKFSKIQEWDCLRKQGLFLKNNIMEKRIKST